MKSTITSLLTLSVLVTQMSINQPAFAAVDAPSESSGAAGKAALIAGDWTWTTPGRNGGPERVSVLSLHIDGSKLNGKVSAPDREGKPSESPITDGKVDADTISFALVRQANGNPNTNLYSGKISADKIVGKVQTTRNGEAQTRDWEAKKIAAVK